MKKLIVAYIFLVSFTCMAQEFQNIDSEEIAPPSETPSVDFTPVSEESFSVTETFEAAADRHGIPNRTFSDLEGVENGYYLISGVFTDSKTLDKTVKKLKRKGFESANYIKNTNNDLNYLYIAYYPFGLEAVDAWVSKLDGTYKNDLWILEIENSEAIGGEGIMFDDEAKTIESGIASLKDQPAMPVIETREDGMSAVTETTPKRGISESSDKTKLIQRADHFFDKMWYAEAAELYEQALEKGDKYRSKDVIQKAADAYYFNTNMEKAYEWYNVLYENYGEEMSSENIFKYAHSLKGTGKFARSKRLMRLYNKKVKDTPNDALANRAQANETTLDNILSSKSDLELKNLAINTQYSDFSPMFLDSNQVVFSSAKDSSIFTSRKYKWNNQPYLDLYVAKINEETNDLKEALKLSKKINTKYHEASVTFSPDNKTMYFTRNNYGKKLKRDKKGINHLKIYKSIKVDTEWTEATEVSFNSDNYSTGHPALSPDGKQLYFVSDMPGSLGKTDIFVVDVLDDGSFSEPRNLGPSINTEQREMFPFFNGEKLYFSSDGLTGLGGLDIYESAYDPENGFQEVKNLGQPINSNKDDFSYIVNEANQQGYFASNREGGKGDDDIYSFKRLTLEETPANHNAIAGVVTELVTGEVMPQALVELLDENGIKLKETIADDEGNFIFEDLDSSTKYLLKTVEDKFVDNERLIETTKNDTVKVDIAMKRLEEMIAIEDGIKKIKTEMIYFNFDKSHIRPDAAKELDKLVNVMKEYPSMVIKIESHTDSRGSKVYNEYLSDKRAKSTRDYIISQGISPERIESAIGYGESKLLNECDGSTPCSEADHVLNRRSEFIITHM
ncbi:OmpA family protein [Zobellia galactanivorans]|uniref:OmpA family protein n=1 Tax=Zobellia galactanivorans (strain DSM 12802 / CCUG 47099 / CIP 106680 / NCIMB 13871 / Dsij) TaxID=63186 RepID=UPI0020902869|nr:OmpA family protein [Zobellia galactanivorans]MDO6809153.1 OmpA family protein [Zobellia galactanivorans]